MLFVTTLRKKMPKSFKDTPATPSKNLFPVVGIGASAGGLEAFKKFIKAIPEKPGIAYILVQHLHPEHPSALPEILQRETRLPVKEIRNNIKVEPDNIYIIPENKLLIATDGVLKLSPRPKDAKNMPIDIFFSSLAEVHQSHAIGVVLSGTGNDGTAGLKHIKEQGGITFVQDVNTAAYDGMPQSAIDAGVADFILAPDQMPLQLKELDGTLNKPEHDGEPTAEELNEDESYWQVLTLLRIRKSVDFKYYKQTTIRRRLLRRVAILKLEKISDYLKLLNDNKLELDVLFNEMLIPVTGFFRDSKVFEDLCSNIFPEIIKDKSNANPLRIWIAGCATGEEAYSIGICLHEFLSEKVSTFKIQLFATDISEQAITKARAGIYHVRQLEGVSEVRLQQFFTKIDGSYQVKKVIRDLCVFASHNFLKDPPFSKIDFISCRNVLIYLEPFLQKKAFSTFHYALSEKGILLLGKSETADRSSEFFLPVNKADKFYKKKPFPGRFIPVTSENSETAIKDTDYAIQSEAGMKDGLQKNVNEIILAKYTPAGVIVDEHNNIVQFRGATGAYLEPSPGKASLDVLRMAQDELSFELRNALHKVKTNHKPFIKEGIPVKNAQGKKQVTIEVVPVPNTIEPHYAIFFTEAIMHREQSVTEKKGNKNKQDNEKDFRIEQLETSLSQAREDMRDITEKQEAANEELQSANEELLSGGEELQSLNEELETSKEELQSTNEELVTVNQELFTRIDQFNRARIYAEGIVTTIHEPLLVLTASSVIKSANNSFYKNFSLTESTTLGKNLFELQDKAWDIPALREHLLAIQNRREIFIEWELTHTFPGLGERTICFNAQPILKENSELLILLALDDITSRKQLEKLHYVQNLHSILKSLPLLTFSADANGTFTYFNNFSLDYCGISLLDALRLGLRSCIQSSQRKEFETAWEHSINTGQPLKEEFQLRRNRDNGYYWHLFQATAIRDDKGTITAWVGVATDIQEQKNKEKAKDEFISVASHELKTPLTTAKAYLQILEQNMQEDEHKDLKYVQKADASITRLHDLIEELLDVSKIQNGKLGLNIAMFDFNDMLSGAIESVQLISPRHNIKKTGHIPYAIKGDKDRLQQVVINILTNAVKYSPKPGDIIVHAAEEKGQVKVSVKDNGIGISKENLDKIFDRYYREEGLPSHVQGLGIGLSISYEIIMRHKGKIWAESEPGKGSTFYFTIPI